MAGVISLIVVLVIWRFSIVFGTVVFEAAGVPRGAAGFEASSALVGAGYTTSQSEYVVRNPVARRVARALVVFGYLGPPVVIALLGVAFVVPTDEDLTHRAVTLVVALLVLVVADRLALFRLIGNRPARAFAGRMIDTTTFETWIAIGDRVVAAIWIPHDASRAEPVLALLGESDVHVLAVEPAGPGAPVFPSDEQPVDLGPGARVVVLAPGASLDALRHDPRREEP